MPLTPYHLGPAILIGLIVFPRLEFFTFLFANIILDIEPFLILVFGWNLALHGLLHSYTIGTMVGFLLGLFMYLTQGYIEKLQQTIRLPQRCSLRCFLISALLGVWLHLFLDALIYSDINLLFPLTGNLLLGLLEQSLIYDVLTICFPLSIFAYLIRVNMEKNRFSEKKSPIKNFQHQRSENMQSKTTSQTVPKDTQIQRPVEKKHSHERINIKQSYSNQIPEMTFKVESVEWEVPKMILGCDKNPEQWGIIGKSKGKTVGIDLNEPHIVFICGKQGSGKGYTIGAICEMLLSRSIPNISQVAKPATIIVFHRPREDLRSEFWSIVEANKNKSEINKLQRDYRLKPTRVITKRELGVFIDPFVFTNEKEKFMADYDSNVYPIGINPGRLTSEDWPHVLSIGKKSGSIYVKKIFQIIKRHQYDIDFGLEVIRREIDESSLNNNQKNFAYMRLETLEDYLKAGDFINDIKIGGVNIFDLRKIMMEPDDVFSVMMLVISSILNTELYASEQIVFVINEAHDYLRRGLSKDFTDYISYLVRKKRHAGTWLLLDTHFPEDVDSKIIKGSDIKIFHKSDILSSELLQKVVEGSDEQPHRLRTGQAIIRSDKSLSGPDKILIVNIRPRLTHHGAPTKVAV